MKPVVLNQEHDSVPRNKQQIEGASRERRGKDKELKHERDEKQVAKRMSRDQQQSVATHCNCCCCCRLH